MYKNIVKVCVVAVMCIVGPRHAYAEGLSWAIPGGVGTFQLPGSFKDILPLVGYDFVQKQAITGASATLMTLGKEIHGYVGAVGEWNTQAPNVQPYLAIGADMIRYIPALNQIKDLQLHGFVRYVASSNHHLGSGVALAYSFGG